jgi:uncharacterized protein (DUF433 family)
MPPAGLSLAERYANANRKTQSKGGRNNLVTMSLTDQMLAIRDILKAEPKELEARITVFKFDRITFDPQIMGGQACIRGMRIPVSLVVNLVANGKQVPEILEEYPDLEPGDIQQSLQYAAWLTQERVYAFSSSSKA